MCQHEIRGLDTIALPSQHLLIIANNRDTKTIGKICSKLIIKRAERRRRHRFSVFIVNFEQILHIVLVFPFLTLNK